MIASREAAKSAKGTISPGNRTSRPPACGRRSAPGPAR